MSRNLFVLGLKLSTKSCSYAYRSNLSYIFSSNFGQFPFPYLLQSFPVNFNPLLKLYSASASSNQCLNRATFDAESKIRDSGKLLYDTDMDSEENVHEKIDVEVACSRNYVDAETEIRDTNKLLYEFDKDNVVEKVDVEVKCGRNDVDAETEIRDTDKLLCEIDTDNVVGKVDVEVKCGRNDVYADRLYEIIMKNSSPESSMEKALDEIGVEVTTPSVVDVLNRLQYEEKTAFRFFMWAGHQENYTHEPQVYNIMIDILSSTKYKVKQFRIVCDLLDYMKRKEKNVVPVEVLLMILREYTEHHLSHLQKFSKKKKIRVKTQPEINALNLLLDALCKCSLVQDAETLFKRVKNKIKPDVLTYNILFFGWSRVRNPKKGMKVLEEMISMGHTPENFTYNTAIDTFCKSGMVTEAAELFEFMKAKGSTMSCPTAKTYSIMILAFVQQNRMDECFKLVSDMITSGCLPDVSTYKDLIEGMCLAGNFEGAYRFLEEMGKKGYPPDIVTYNCFLKVLCENKKSDEALKLYGIMIDVNCLPSVQTFNMLMSMFFKMGDLDGAFETWREMDKRRCARDTDSYCVMIEGLFGCDKIEDASLLLDEVMNKEMKLPYQKFDSFLMQLSVTGNLKAILKLSAHMRKFYNPAMGRRFALSQKRKSVSLRGK